MSFSRTPEVEPLAAQAADETPVAEEAPEEKAWTKEVSFSRTPVVEPLAAQPADLPYAIGSSPLRARLQNGVDRAAGKGARDSVVFVDSTAFVVSVRNRTVITAVDRDHMKDHVFTNIDSAVIA